MMRCGCIYFLLSMAFQSICQCMKQDYVWHIEIPNEDYTEDTHPILKAYHSKDRTRFHQYCGTGWQEEFIKIQKENLAKDPPRRLVSTSNGQGASDRLVGLLTEFYAAFLFKRAFQVIKSGDVVAPFEGALEQNYIQWSISDDNDRKNVLNYIDNRVSNESVQTLNYFNGLPLFADDFETRHPGGMIPLMGDVPTVIITSNRGNTYNLIGTSNYSSLLLQYNMNPVYGAYCAFHYLFKPNRETLTLSYEHAKALSEENVIKIGIQIRVGDSVFGDPNDKTLTDPDVPYFQNFFDCAQHIEDTIRAYDDSKEFLWYFMSDSMGLKQSIKQRYGSKVITETIHRPGHNIGSKNPFTLQLVMAEVLTISLCDYFILSHNSGIGKFGAWLSNNRADNKTFLEHRDHLVRDRPNEPKCKQYKTPNMALSNAVTGIS